VILQTIKYRVLRYYHHVIKSVVGWRQVRRRTCLE